MTRLDMDIETFSSNDILNGVYKYADADDFEILLLSYAYDFGEVKTIDLTKEELPDDLTEDILHGDTKLCAWNAAFERVCLSRYFRDKGLIEGFLPPERWDDPMVRARELGLPASLKRCAEYLKMDEQKDAAGTQLINYFSKPCKPTKANGKRTRNLPEHDPERWAEYVYYNAQDVRTQMAIAKEVEKYGMHEREWDHFYLDQHMHDRGVGVDMALAEQAVEIDEEIRSEGLERMKELTGLDNPNSVKQLKDWLKEQGHDFPTLGKKVVQAYVDGGLVKGKAKEVLELRLSLSNSSTKKYLRVEEATCRDGRLHGILQFYGANRTGRYAGRLLQVQNLPRNHMTLLDEARTFVKRGDRETLELLFDDVPDVLKQLIRTVLVAKEGHTFIVSDFSAIEARVIAWLAGEQKVLKAFRDHGKIYEATASHMFNIPLDEVDKDMRQRGKVATLACGYQGGKGALIAMGALEMGIPENELQGLVDQWRRANSKIVDFWYDTERLAMTAVRDHKPQRGPQGLKFYMRGTYLFIQLPSGRSLAYPNARLEDGKFGEKIVFDGQGTKVMFEKQDTYGGKLVENIVQATARDILAEALQRLEARGFPVVFHVHDEAIAEVPKDTHTVEEMNEIMAIQPDWAEGLPLNAEGFSSDYYMKD
ncbi:DNA polymerase [Aerococcus urinae]|uniref:DNA polymerase n=1 Tax=Aerococcus urinae TaxID=1376 RepID=UPI00254D26B8|nr:DNA polymerase [Aerococcus urinae]MDK6688299.1 DNA polymerase [Aerococcus urinae]